MNPQLIPLIELQTLDLRVSEIREQQRKTPQLIDAAEAPYKEALRLQQEAKAALEALSKERRDRERDLEAHEGQTDKMKTRLSELKTNKEYQAHLFEIEMANKKKGEIEEQILMLMEKMEARQKEIKEVQVKAAEAERRFQQEKGKLETAAADLASELTQLEQKQRDVTAIVGKDLLNRYTKLKATRKDLALAPIRNGICWGCRLQIPPQLVAEVRRSEGLLTCSYCQRILYVEAEPVIVPAARAGPTEEELEAAEDDVQTT
ncbi:MAG TPA: C4-type zinc ribbon domain-containing protein [Nitrospiraceae bacterium]|nr:C4-type zinc ribbon domain-containing protein [Nitrospiraceae bacterium]